MSNLKGILACSLSVLVAGMTIASSADARGFSGGRSFSRPSFSHMHKAPTPKILRAPKTTINKHAHVTKQTTVINATPSTGSTFLSTFGGSMAGSMVGNYAYDSMNENTEQQEQPQVQYIPVQPTQNQQ